ncbi:MAG: methyltransferase domain-containing protein [Deltaproteobacteria bacterium]|nr:methyltransferase domain-containing protein [Deltaproteobacteria bacterium]
MAISVETIRPSKVRNLFHHYAGIGFLALIKAKSALYGYRTPRTFGIEDFKRAVDYDATVVERWLYHLKSYTGKSDISGKTVLELGPGADLGVGLILLAKGADKYNSLDVNNLVESVPDALYNELFTRIEKGGHKNTDELKRQLALTRSGKNDRLDYIVTRDFDVTVFGKNTVDIVFSQAAFEHFPDMDRTVTQLSTVVKKGAVLIAEIDLKTHTRWIRDADPLNIYRYGDFIYNLFACPGSPNRLRPVDYRRMFERNGWVKVRTTPVIKLEDGYVSKVGPSLSRRFRGAESEIQHLSVILSATKG